MAHTKAKGATKLGRESQSKRLGVKKFAGEKVKIGNIIIRQRGFKYRAGNNVLIGKDHTIYAKIDGVVKFSRKKVTKFTGKLKAVTFANVIPGKEINKD